MKNQIAAFKDLENPIMEAKAMANLLVKFWDATGVIFDRPEEGNAITFALYDVERRLGEISQQFQDCFDVREPR